ncbi:MAG: TonB-dependent receptor [Longimicrobiales bacterium]
MRFPIAPVLAAALVALAALALAHPAAAQTATLRGRVVDAVTRSPVAGADVVVSGARRVLTDAEGRFAVGALSPGMVVVEVGFLGYRPALVSEVVVQTSRPTYVEVLLERQAIEVEGFVVRAGAFRVPDAAPTSVRLLAAEELRRTPGGFQDVSRTLLSLPGVLGGVDNRNDLVVRGGGPGENAYYLDGIRIPQINHFATQGATGGALGLVNVDFIRETEFFSGAFPVQYGDALSSVLLVENRPGSPDGVKGDVTLGASEAALTLDGPLGGKANWLFSARRSYLQFLFQALGLPIRPDYWDAQLRVEAEPTSRDRFLLVGLGALDNFDIVTPDADDSFENREIFERVLDNDQESYTLGASWRRLVGDGYLTTAVSRSASDFRFADQGTDGNPVLSNRSVETDTRFTVDGEVARGTAWSFGFGGGAARVGLDTDFFQRATPGGTLVSDLRWDDALGLWKGWGYAQATRKLADGRLALTAGLRGDGVSALDESFALSPRASARFDLTSTVTLKASGGAFHQTPNLISLGVRESEERVNLDLPQLRNHQLAAGAAWQATTGLRVSAEAFWKSYDQVPVLASDPRIALPNLGGDYGFVGAEPLRSTGTGRARGVELFAQQKLLGATYLIGAYTLSWSEYAGEDGVLRPSSWDRRHALSLTWGYRPDAKWEVGAKLRALSGLAYTPFDLGRSADEYALTGRGVLDWSKVGAARTPAYARLDLRVERMFSFESWNGVLYLDVQNVTGRGNVAGYDYTEDPAYPGRVRPQTSTTFLPTFGFSIEF